MDQDSQFQLRPAPPPATAGHLPTLSVPGVGHLQILCCAGARHLPTPRPFPSFWHVHGFLSEYNYTEDFTGKENRLAQKPCKERHVVDFMHAFLHCLSSQNYIAKSGAIKVNKSFWSLNQISVDIIWKASFHIYKTIHNINYNSGRSWNWLMHNNFKVRIVRLLCQARLSFWSHAHPVSKQFTSFISVLIKVMTLVWLSPSESVRRRNWFVAWKKDRHVHQTSFR